MKRTTYILIGIFFANILLAVGYLGYLRTTLVDTPMCSFDLSNQSGSIDLSGVHTLELVNNGRFYYIERGIVKITSSKDGRPGTMSYPESDLLKIDKKDGVLRVMLDIADCDPNSNEDVKKGFVIEGLNINIEADQTLTRIVSDAAFSVSLSKMQLDSLNLNTSLADIDSCIVRSLVLGGKTLSVNQSQINELHIDLDKVNVWTLKESKGKTLYLTGSQRHQNNISADHFDRLVWLPKTDDARLGVNLKERAEITIKR